MLEGLLGALIGINPIGAVGVTRQLLRALTVVELNSYIAILAPPKHQK